MRRLNDKGNVIAMTFVIVLLVGLISASLISLMAYAVPLRVSNRNAWEEKMVLESCLHGIIVDIDHETIDLDTTAGFVPYECFGGTTMEYSIEALAEHWRIVVRFADTEIQRSLTIEMDEFLTVISRRHDH